MFVTITDIPAGGIVSISTLSASEISTTIVPLAGNDSAASILTSSSIGIICSLDCYNIIVENNTVYNNTKMWIMLSRNMTNSIVKNNNVSNEDRGIVISESSNNEIYNNTVSRSGSGMIWMRIHSIIPYAIIL